MILLGFIEQDHGHPLPRPPRREIYISTVPAFSDGLLYHLISFYGDHIFCRFLGHRSLSNTLYRKVYKVIVQYYVL